MLLAVSAPRCVGCGHSVADHHGVTKAGYSAPRIACRRETDRYEVCTCDGYDAGGVPVGVGMSKP